MEKVAGKSRTYREVAEAHDVPLIVAIGAHRFTGVTLDDVDDMLRGLAAPKIKLQFDQGDPYLGSQTLSLAPVPPWPWPRSLSGLLWISNKLPFSLTARGNPAAPRPMPHPLLALDGSCGSQTVSG